MPCDESLAKRLRDAAGNGRGIEHKAMFGGTAVLVNGHMTCGITKDDELVVRLDYPAAAKAATRKHARICDFTGRPMRGMVLVKRAGFKDKRSLESWIRPAFEHTRSLPPKAAKAPLPASKARTAKSSKRATGRGATKGSS